MFNHIMIIPFKFLSSSSEDPERELKLLLRREALESKVKEDGTDVQPYSSGMSLLES